MRRAAFALLPMSLLLLTVEVAVRITGGGHPADVTVDALQMAPHTTRIWSLVPGEGSLAGVPHTIGEDTLRVVAETGADLRVLTLGDSSIFGHGVVDADTLHANLAASLGERGVSADVLCGGVPGYSTAQSLLLLDEVGWDLEPDLLVIGNLWSDNTFEYFVDSEWLAELHSPVRRLDRALSWSAAWDWFRGLQEPEQAVERAGLPISWVREPYPTSEGRRRVPLEDYAANLETMLLQAEARGVGVIFLAPCNIHRLGESLPISIWDPYFEVMQLVADRRGVPVVQAVEALRGAGLDVKAAFLDRMHPTGAGNRAYGEALAEALVAAGWPQDRLVPDAGPGPVQVTIEDPFAAR